MKSLIFTVFSLTTFNAFAYINPYHLFSTDFSVVSPNSELIVKNMPVVRSQDTVGICYAFADAAIIEHKICKNQNIDCANLPSDQRISVFDLAKYALKPQNNSDDRDSDSYQNLPSPLSQGGTSILTLLHSTTRTQEVSKESCAPFDKAVAKFGGDPDKEEAAWKDLEQKYNLAKSKSDVCLQCLADQVANDFDISKERVDVLKAFSAETFNSFLYNLFIPQECSKKSNIIKLKNIGKIGRFPSDNIRNITNDEYIKQIKSLLSKQIPVSTSVCSEKVRAASSVGNCTEGHQVVVTGYRKICKKNNECYDSIKIHNSYGQSWQDKNDDGWVVAKDFIDRIPRGEYDTLTWLE